MRKIVLFMPNPVPPPRPWRGLPLPLLSISRFLAKENYEIKIFSRFLTPNLEEELLGQSKDAICFGISAMIGYQIYDGLQIAKLIKKKHPKLPIVWGGWHPSILPEQTARNKNVDIVVKGEGERTFTEVVHALEKGSDLNKISGIVYKRKGRIVSTKNRLFEDINNFPSLPYHLVDVEKCIISNTSGERELLYISSFGCPYHCGFCVEPIVNKGCWSGLKAKRVVNEWEELTKKYKVNTYVVADSNFFVDKKRVYDICNGIIKKNLKIKWKHANGRVSQLANFEPEIWEAMEKSGCNLINTGAESGSQKALNFIHKDIEIKDIIKFTKLCKKYHIKIQFSFLLGLPWSKNLKKNSGLVEEEYKNTFSLINKLLDISQKNHFTYYIYLPYPGASLFNRAVRLGLKVPKNLEGWSNYLLSPTDAFKTVTRQKWITPKQARLVNMLSQYIFAFMDDDSFKFANQTSKALRKNIFKLLYPIIRLVVRFRWKYKLFSFPVDFWFFNLLKKYGKLE